MSFQRPEALWGLVPVLLMVLAVSWPLRRRLVTLLLRLLAAAALVIALARPAKNADAPEAELICVVDVSASMGPLEDVQAQVDRALAEAPTHAAVRMVLATEEPRELQPLRPRTREFPKLASVVKQRDGSPLGAAVSLAQALAQRPESTRILVLSDGRADRSEFSASAVAPLALAPVEWRSFGAISAHPVLRPIAFPLTAPIGSTITLNIEIESARGEPVTVSLERLHPAGDRETFSVIPGESLRRALEVKVRGRNEWAIALLDSQGVPIVESAMRALTFGTAPHLVWVLEDARAPSVAQEVQRLLGPGALVVARRVQELDANESFAEPATVLLADVPASALAPHIREALVRAVDQGLGLVATGGRRSFGPGGYGGTALEHILPLRSVQKEERRDPSASLAIIIDTSGSMMGNRMDIAKEVARLALQRLKPHDKVGIVEFHGAKRWAAPLQPASHSVDIQRALNRLVAGGGTVILPAIEEAYYGLLNVRTRTRHVLVLTDGGVEDGQFESLIRKMANHGMTVSTVLVGGSSSHSSFLVELAQWGRGRYYHAPDRFNLPEVLIKQPESSLLSPFLESKARVETGPVTVAGDELSFSEPTEIAGQVEVEAKRSADVLLHTQAGQPVLARWRFGTGLVIALATEVSGPWTGSLSASTEYSRLFSAIVRESAAPPKSEFQLNGRVDRDALSVAITSEVAGDVPPSVQIVVQDAAETKQSRSWIASRSGTVGQVSHVFSNLSPGRATVQVLDAAGTVQATGLAAIPERREFSRVNPIPAPKSPGTETTSSSAAPRQTEIWPYFVGLGLFFFLLHIATRRISRGPAVLAFLAVLFLSAPQLAAQAPVATPEPLAAEMMLVLERAVLDQDPAALREVARQVVARDGHATALREHLLTQSKAAPNKLVLWTLLADLHLLEGRPALAVKTMESLEREKRLDLLGWMVLARAREALGLDEAAVANLESALPLATDAESAFALRVRIASILFTQPKGKDRALATLGALFAEPAASQDLRFHLAYLAALHGASELILKLEARTSDSDTQFRDHLLIGTFALRDLNHDLAKRHFQEAIRVAPLPRDRRFAQERLIASHRNAKTLDRLASEWLAEKDASDERREALVALLRELRRPEEALELVLAASRDDGAVSSEVRQKDLQREVIGLALECRKDGEIEAAYARLVEAEPKKLAWRSGLAMLYLLQGKRELAAKVFENALLQVEEGKACLRIAEMTGEIGLEEVSILAAEKAQTKDPVSAFRGRLFVAEHEFKKGLSEDAHQRLVALEKEVEKDEAALLQIADTYDRWKRSDESIRVLKGVYERTKAEDVALRLGWLQEKAKAVVESLDLWLTVWRDSKITARVRQAEDRILDLGARNGRLAKLAIELEADLDAQRGSARHLLFLVKIYTRAHDPVSAVEILREHGPRLMNGELEQLHAMAQVYQHCDDYRRYEETLHRLSEIDPENGADYQQQLVLGAIERGKGRQVKRALDRLTATYGNSMESAEFSAGALALVQLHDESAITYAKVLAAHPDRVETHLLYGNVLRDSGRGEEGIHHFLDLCDHADKDDLFTVAVDGVLNLNGTRAVNLATLRRVKERMAFKPDKGFLYQLAADLHEELKDVDGQFLLTSLFAVVAGERRSAVLRELMDLAQSAGRLNDVVFYGRGLMALGDEMPPDVYLELGYTLIKQGELSSAERVFGRLRAENDFVGMQRKIAGYYEQAAYFEDAERLLRQAILARPEDPELLLDVARLAEISGRDEQAGRDYLTAVDVLLRQTPSRVAEAKEAKAKGEGARNVIFTSTGARIVFLGGVGSYDRNEDPWDRLSPDAIRGLLACSPATLVSEMEGRVDRERTALVEGSAVAEKLATNLRLSRLLPMARRVAAAYGKWEIADRLDRETLVLYPKDTGTRNAAIEERERDGAFARAVALSAALGAEKPEEEDVARQTRRLLSDAAELDRLLAAGRMAPGLAARLSRQLLILGREAAARSVLENADPVGTRPEVDEAITLVNVALVLSDSEALQVWFLRWLEVAGGAAGTPMASQWLRNQVVRLWPYLTEATRAVVPVRLKELVANSKKERRAALEAFRIELARRFQWPEVGTLDGLKEVVDATGDNFYQLQRIVRLALPEDRGALLRYAVGRSKEIYLTQVLEFAESTPGELNADTMEAVTEAFRLGVKKSRSGNAHQVLSAVARLVAWENRREFALKLVEELVGAGIETEVPLLARAFLRLLAPDADAGTEEEFKESLSKLLTRRDPAWGQRQLVEHVCDRANPRIQKLAMEVVESVERGGQRTPLSVQLRLRHGGVELALNNAEAYLARAWKELPANDEMRETYFDHLEEHGRWSVLAAEMAEWLRTKSADNLYAYNQLARAYHELERPTDVILALNRAGTYTDYGLLMSVHFGMQNLEAVRQSLRRQGAVEGRYMGSHETVRLAPGSGGIEAQLAAAATEESNDGLFGPLVRLRHSLFWRLAATPFGEAELERLFRSRSESAPGEDDPLSLSIARAHLLRVGRETVVSELETRLAQGSVVAKDCVLAVVLAGLAPKEFPPTLLPILGQIRDRALDDPDVDEGLLNNLAELYLELGRPEEARPLLAFRLAEAISNPQSGSGSTFFALEKLLKTWPEAEREAVRRAHLERLDPSVGGIIDLGSELEFLKQWKAIAPPEDVKRRLKKAEEFIENRPAAEFNAILSDRQALASALREFDDFAAWTVQVDHIVNLILENPRRLGFSPYTLLGSPKKATADVDRYVSYCLSAIEKLSKDQRKRLENGFVNWLALSGRYAEARRLLESVHGGPPPAAEERLVLADILRKLGDEAGAIAIERKLLDEDALNLRRLERVLDHVAKSESEAQAQSIAARVAKYSDHPAALRRAVRYHMESGDRVQALELLRRLEAVAPTHSELAPLREALGR